MTLPEVHRVVTGHADDGLAVVSSQGSLPVVRELDAIPGVIFHEIWNTTGTPAPINNASDPTFSKLSLPPPTLGTRIRFVDFPPDNKLPNKDEKSVKAVFEEIGDPDVSTLTQNSPHAFMHRTETIDYGIVLSGEITLILDNSEIDLKLGSVVVQRGTNHSWSNRSTSYCRMAFVLIDAKFEPDIKTALENFENQNSNKAHSSHD